MMQAESEATGRRQTILIPTTEGVVEVAARVIGPFAITCTLPGNVGGARRADGTHGVTITHLETGACVGHAIGLDYGRALRLVGELRALGDWSEWRDFTREQKRKLRELIGAAREDSQALPEASHEIVSPPYIALNRNRRRP